MRMLVTGSGGYIAKGVISQLLQRGHKVIAVGHGPSGLSDANLTEIIGDIFDFDFRDTVFFPDAVVHLAWRDGFNHQALSHLEDLPKHYEFLQRAVRAGVSHIAVMGTMHEVGYWEGEVDDSTPCNPTTPYAVAKNALRQLFLNMAKNEDICCQWLRGFYLCSDDGRGNSIFSKLINSAKAGENSFPFTTGLCQYDFLPYDEFCFQVASVVTQKKVSGIINICSGSPIALRDYVEDFIKRNELELTLEYGKYPDRPYDSPAIWGSAEKILTILDCEHVSSH